MHSRQSRRYPHLERIFPAGHHRPRRPGTPLHELWRGPHPTYGGLARGALRVPGEPRSRDIQRVSPGRFSSASDRRLRRGRIGLDAHWHRGAQETRGGCYFLGEPSVARLTRCTGPGHGHDRAGRIDPCLTRTGLLFAQDPALGSRNRPGYPSRPQRGSRSAGLALCGAPRLSGKTTSLYGRPAPAIRCAEESSSLSSSWPSS